LAHALARVGLLQPAHTDAPAGARPNLVARSCEHCLSWSGKAERLCKGCRRFAATHPDTERCRRCRRVLPVAHGHCRLCQLVLNGRRLDAAAPDQLWLGGHLAPRLIARAMESAGRGRSGGSPQATPPVSRLAISSTRDSSPCSGSRSAIGIARTWPPCPA
jgi:hypothetical protein